MSLTKNAATARLTREMVESEAAVADALVAAAALLHSASLANREFSDTPVVKAQSAFLHLSKMIAGLVEARGEALRFHGVLLDIGREMGATESPYCPPKNSVETEERQAA